MLVVDPLKRITIPEIRAHPWFKQRLPLYLAIPASVAEAEVEAAAAARAHQQRQGILGGLSHRPSVGGGLGLGLSRTMSSGSIGSSTSIGEASSLAIREGLGLSDELDADILETVLKLGMNPTVHSVHDVERFVRKSGKRGEG
jgi:hypothetical protein